MKMPSKKRSAKGNRGAIGPRRQPSPGTRIKERGANPPTLGVSLAAAKSQWSSGEWKALAELDVAALDDHPDRASLALLAASAHQQIGNHDQARLLASRSLAWGCPRRQVAETLLAGVHNTLGRVSALKQDDARAERHFWAAVAEGGDASTATHVRCVREMAELGLLPQAASLLDRELRAAAHPTQRPKQQQARLTMLEAQIELLRGELILAAQRQQLVRAAAAVSAPGVSAGNAEWREQLCKRAVSQLGQDLWVLERTGYKRGGFFVDFGATNGVSLSNTWLLEKEFDWRGICAEPNPRFFKQLGKNRSCIVSDACVGARSGEVVEFVLADEFSGMTKHAALDGHEAKRSAFLTDARNLVTLRTISLDDLLINHGAPRRIDYLSIDTEGSEFEILAAFPFSDWQIDLITVEHNFTAQREQIHRLLASHGYTRVEAKWDDWYFRDTAGNHPAGSSPCGACD